MKKTFLLLTILVVVILLFFLYERIFVLKLIGPLSLLVIALLVCIIIYLLATYLLYDTVHRDKLMGIWLVLISTFTTYLIVDLLAGFLLIAPLSPKLIADDYRHHKLAPDSLAQFEHSDFSYLQRTNRQGLRGTEFSPKKPQGIYRIVMLGDSFTMGKGVQDSETFSVLLQEKLNQSSLACPGTKFEILNAGVDSYAPLLSYIFLVRELADFEPDMIVLNLDNSDLIQETAYRGIATLDADGEISAVPGKFEGYGFFIRVRLWMERNLYLTRLLMFYSTQLLEQQDLTVSGVVEQANREVLAHTLSGDSVDRSQQWHDLFDSISRIHEYAMQNNIRFKLAIYPWAHQINDRDWIPGRYTFMSRTDKSSPKSENYIQQRSSELGIELLNLYPEFLADRGTEPLYFNHDLHWTPSGHEIMAEGLRKLLLTGGSIGCESPS